MRLRVITNLYKRVNTLYNNMKLYCILAVLLFCLVQPRKRAVGMGATARTRRSKAFSSIGRGIASFWNKGVEDSQLLTKGEEMQAEVNRAKLHDDMLDNSSSFWSIVVISILGVLGILLFLRCRSSEEENNDIDYERIRQKREERQKRNRVLEALDEHGVHPDRANGNIYRIRL